MCTCMSMRACESVCKRTCVCERVCVGACVSVHERRVHYRAVKLNIISYTYIPQFLVLGRVRVSPAPSAL